MPEIQDDIHIATDEELLNPAPAVLETCEINFSKASRAFARRLRELGNHQQAVRVLERLVFFRRKIAGQGDVQYMRSVCDLACIHREENHYEEAEALLEPLLGLCKRLLGAEHPVTLETSQLLASCYGRRGNLSAAETMLNGVLALQRQQLGPAHINICRTLNSLCLVYCKQGRLKSARDAYLRSVTDLEDNVGVEDLDLLEALPTIARFYSDDGDDLHAEMTWERLFSATASRVGGWASEDPQLFVALEAFAQFYEERDRYEEARNLWAKVYLARKRELGAAHALTLDSQSCLSNAFYSLEAYQQASELAESEVQVRLEDLAHSSSTVTMSRLCKILEAKLWLGMCYLRSDRWERAENVLCEVISISKDLRRENPIYFLSLQTKGHYWMGNLRQAQDRLEDARDHLRQALRYCKNRPEAMSGHTVTYMASLTNVLLMLGQMEEVEPLTKEAIELSEATDGISSRKTIELVSILAYCYALQRRFVEAKPLLQRVLSTWETELGPTHFYFLVALRCAAMCDAGLGEYGEAETSFERVVHGFEVVEGFHGESTTECRRQLLEVLEAQEKFDKMNALKSEWAAKGAKSIKAQEGESEIGVESEARDTLPNSHQSDFQTPPT